MQVNSVNNQQQSFGMAFTKMNDSAKKALKKRIKEKDFAKLQDLINSQNNNKNVNIYLYTTGPDSTRLGANIYPTSVSSSSNICMQSPREGFINSLRSPLHFIESLCNKANKMSAKVEENSKMDNLFKSLD